MTMDGWFIVYRHLSAGEDVAKVVLMGALLSKALYQVTARRARQLSRPNSCLP